MNVNNILRKIPLITQQLRYIANSTNALENFLPPQFTPIDVQQNLVRSRSFERKNEFFERDDCGKRSLSVPSSGAQVLEGGILQHNNTESVKQTRYFVTVTQKDGNLNKRQTRNISFLKKLFGESENNCPVPIICEKKVDKDGKVKLVCTPYDFQNPPNKKKYETVGSSKGELTTESGKMAMDVKQVTYKKDDVNAVATKELERSHLTAACTKLTTEKEGIPTKEDAKGMPVFDFKLLENQTASKESKASEKSNENQESRKYKVDDKKLAELDQTTVSKSKPKRKEDIFECNAIPMKELDSSISEPKPKSKSLIIYCPIASESKSPIKKTTSLTKLEKGTSKSKPQSQKASSTSSSNVSDSKLQSDKPTSACTQFKSKSQLEKVTKSNSQSRMVSCPVVSESKTQPKTIYINAESKSKPKLRKAINSKPQSLVASCPIASEPKPQLENVSACVEPKSKSKLKQATNSYSNPQVTSCPVASESKTEVETFSAKSKPQLEKTINSKPQSCSIESKSEKKTSNITKSAPQLNKSNLPSVVSKTKLLPGKTNSKIPSPAAYDTDQCFEKIVCPLEFETEPSQSDPVKSSKGSPLEQKPISAKNQPETGFKKVATLVALVRKVVFAKIASLESQVKSKPSKVRTTKKMQNPNISSPVITPLKLKSTNIFSSSKTISSVQKETKLESQKNIPPVKTETTLKSELKLESPKLIAPVKMETKLESPANLKSSNIIIPEKAEPKLESSLKSETKLEPTKITPSEKVVSKPISSEIPESSVDSETCTLPKSNTTKKLVEPECQNSLESDKSKTKAQSSTTEPYKIKYALDPYPRDPNEEKCPKLPFCPTNYVEKPSVINDPCKKTSEKVEESCATNNVVAVDASQTIKPKDDSIKNTECNVTKIEAKDDSLKTGPTLITSLCPKIDGTVKNITPITALCPKIDTKDTSLKKTVLITALCPKVEPKDNSFKKPVSTATLITAACPTIEPLKNVASNLLPITALCPKNDLDDWRTYGYDAKQIEDMENPYKKILAGLTQPVTYGDPKCDRDCEQREPVVTPVIMRDPMSCVIPKQDPQIDGEIREPKFEETMICDKCDPCNNKKKKCDFGGPESRKEKSSPVEGTCNRFCPDDNAKDSLECRRCRRYEVCEDPKPKPKPIDCSSCPEIIPPLCPPPCPPVSSCSKPPPASLCPPKPMNICCPRPSKPKPLCQPKCPPCEKPCCPDIVPVCPTPNVCCHELEEGVKFRETPIEDVLATEDKPIKPCPVERAPPPPNKPSGPPICPGKMTHTNWVPVPIRRKQPGPSLNRAGKCGVTHFDKECAVGYAKASDTKQKAKRRTPSLSAKLPKPVQQKKGFLDGFKGLVKNAKVILPGSGNKGGKSAKSASRGAPHRNVDPQDYLYKLPEMGDDGKIKRSDEVWPFVLNKEEIKKSKNSKKPDADVDKSKTPTSKSECN